MEKQTLEKLVNEGLSIRKMGEITKTTYTKVRYWLDKYGLKTNGYDKKYKWDIETLREAVEKSECKSDVLRNLGISTKSGNFQTLDRYLKKYGISGEGLKYDNKRGNKWVKKYTNDDIFCENSHMSGKNIKVRIIREGLIEYKCQECDITDEWKGKKIQLQLDHINGKNDDNRLENLRFLCPNCHSQTDTYAAKNKGTLV